MKPRLKRRDFLKTLGMGAAALSVSSFQGCGRKPAARTGPPNFVVIFTDDQGYADVGCFGAEGFETPNLDRMAKQGMRFTSFYVSQAVCSASRSSLITGCYPNRVSIYGALGPRAEIGLNPEEETIAEVLKKKGYACGIFGKWHLGHHREFLPLQQGFDEYLGLPYSNDMWPVWYDGTPSPQDHNKATYPYLPLIDGYETVEKLTTMEDIDMLTTRYTERAVRFIEKNKDRPFFLYVPHSMPHTPLGVSDKFRGKSQQGKYGDVIMEIDWSVGQILKALKKHNLENNTLVVFTSDNGPWLNFGKHAGSVGPLREGKGTSWEGGQRVPCIMRWPGHIPKGRDCDNIASTMDLLPTFAAIAGSPLPKNKIDGVNILSLLEGKPEANPRDHLFYYYGRPLQAVRQGKWKLHFPHGYRSYEGVEPGKNGLPGPYGHGETGLELYDLKNDIGERHDVADQYPEVVEKLQALGEKAREELGDGKLIGKGVRPCGRVSPSEKEK
jgi:arylsulfatase A-like enzyme